MVHDTYDTSDTYSQSGVAEPTWSQCGENMRHRPPGCAADPPEGKIRKHVKIHDGRKAELLKNHGFLYGFCMVVKSRKIDMQKLLKKTIGFCMVFGSTCRKVYYLHRKTRDDKRAPGKTTKGQDLVLIVL